MNNRKRGRRVGGNWELVGVAPPEPGTRVIWASPYRTEFRDLLLDDPVIAQAVWRNVRTGRQITEMLYSPVKRLGGDSGRQEPPCPVQGSPTFLEDLRALEVCEKGPHFLGYAGPGEDLTRFRERAKRVQRRWRANQLASIEKGVLQTAEMEGWPEMRAQDMLRQEQNRVKAEWTELDRYWAERARQEALSETTPASVSEQWALRFDRGEFR